MDQSKNNDMTKQKHFLDIVYSFYKTMKEKEITLIYEGEITHDITLAFTKMTEDNLSKHDEESSVQRKVYHVMIECLQNITKHAGNTNENNQSSVGKGIFLVGRTDTEYSITSGNAIENSKLEKLSSFIDQINTLNKSELDNLYAKQIVEGTLSEKGGAGLGLIDIVRKTGRKLKYQFLHVDKDFSFFILTSYISRNINK